jgi:hypothetical protein
MESRNNINTSQTKKIKPENNQNINSFYDKNLKPADSLKDRMFAYFKRDKSKTEENVGFINRQIPFYWHGK